MAINSISGQQVQTAHIPSQGGRATGTPDDTASPRAAPETATLKTAVQGVLEMEKNAVADQRNTKKSPSDQQLASAVDKLNEFVKTSSSNLQFTVDKESGIRIVKVVNPETKELIRQFPSEEVVEIAKALNKLQGLLIKQTA